MTKPTPGGAPADRSADIEAWNERAFPAPAPAAPTPPRARGDDDAPPRRCETGEVDLDLSCMACGAAEGEACRR